MEATLYKLKVRVRGSEFEAEGPEELVREQFQAFLQIANASNPQGKEEDSARTNRDEERRNGSSGPDPVNKQWDRAFAVDADQCASLLVLPASKNAISDAIILLIYGNQIIGSIDAVQSARLMTAAQQSGLRIDRIDRNLSAEHRRYVIKGGNRKGSRYSLNNRGRVYAQQLLETMFD
jgi:hypothetical protein